MVAFPFIPSGESLELADDVRDLFEDLSASLQNQDRAFSGEFRPALDVRETEHAIEVVVDVAGVPREAIRVLFRSGLLLVAGEKAATSPGPDQTFHLVEREFGRFARAVRVTGAVDVAAASATFTDGELVVLLPKRPERRGGPHRIAVATAGEPPA